MKSISFRPVKGKVKYIMFAEGNGAIKYEVPAFDCLFETEIVDAYTHETWKKNGSNRKNYTNQMSIAEERFIHEAQVNPDLRQKCSAEQLESIEQGKFPNDLTAHHDRPSGKGAKNVVMQIVDTETHRQQSHKGSSAMANPKIRERDYAANYGDQTPLQNLKDKAEYTAIKHPVAAGAAAGGLTACAINFLMRKLGVSETKSLIVSAVLGCIAGVFTHRAITCHSENIYIGD